MALSRSREFEADRTGARLIGDGEPLARALLKLEQGARQIPMNVQPAQAQKYIVNPLTGRKVQFAKLFTTHPPVEERVGRLRAGEWANS
ncbi:MAG: M48 family metalloprotease, partial [Acidimicrobiales bacterium]